MTQIKAEAQHLEMGTPGTVTVHVKAAKGEMWNVFTFHVTVLYMFAMLEMLYKEM